MLRPSYSIKFCKRPLLTFLNLKIKLMLNWLTVWKLSKYRVFPGPYFPVFGLLIPIQSEYRKIRIRQNSVFGHFSLSDCSFFRCWCLPYPASFPCYFRRHRHKQTAKNIANQFDIICCLCYSCCSTIVNCIMG